MKKPVLLLVLASALAGCADGQARDQASAAEERAESANARAEEVEMKLNELEDRVSNLEYNQAL